MEREYESYEIVELHEDSDFNMLNGCEVVDDPYTDDNDEQCAWQVLGEVEYNNGDNWYEVITGFATEDQAKRYLEATERANLLCDHARVSLEATLQTIKAENAKD
jgi:hypothetical protein